MGCRPPHARAKKSNRGGYTHYFLKYLIISPVLRHDTVFPSIDGTGEPLCKTPAVSSLRPGDAGPSGLKLKKTSTIAQSHECHCAVVI